MGTNFYWQRDKINGTKFKEYLEIKKKQDLIYFRAKGYAITALDDEYFYHIGKRSAAGYYCKKCHLSVCEGGENGVHDGIFEHPKECPLCGKELHSSITSFNWYDYNRDRYLLDELKDTDIKLITNEYGEEFTVKEFLNEIDEEIYFFSKELFS